MCGELHKALKNYNRAIGDDKERVALKLQRANIFVQMDSLERALEDYNDIIAKEPANSSALFFRACICSEMG
jgi:tetratricopeptide (TPR) repeat protein